MNVTLFFDANNLAHRTLFGAGVITFKPNSKTEIENVDWQLFRWRFFDSILSSLFVKKNVNELILAIDGPNSWRKKLWPRYKEKRLAQRERIDLDWDMFFSQYEQIQSEISQHVPFKVVKVDRCEGDDVIGILCNYIINDCHIISTDKDFLQLSHKATLYNPLTKEELRHPNPELFLQEQCLMGQAKDNIWNVKTPLDYPDDKRKPGLGEKTAEKILISGLDKWLDENNLRERYLFNRKLIDFNLIPEIIKTKIIERYDSIKLPHPSGIYNLFQKNNWQGYLDDFTRIEDRLCKLL